MEILKTLLANTFDKRIRRLENRTIQQMNDLRFTKDCFAKQGKLIDKFATIKIEPPRTLTRNRTVDNLKRDASAKPMRSKLRDKTPNNTSAVSKEKKNGTMNRTLRSKTPIRGKANESVHNGKKNNISIKNNNTLHKSPQSVKQNEKLRAKTPDGRAIPRRPKKKTNEGNNKVKVSTTEQKIIKRVANNNTESNHNEIHSPDESKNDESYDDFNPEDIKEFPKEEIIKDQEPKRTQISNIDELHFVSVPPTPKKEEKIPIVEFNKQEFLESTQNRENLMLIASFLDNNSKINLFSIRKKFKYYLASEIENLRRQFEVNNDITMTSKIIDKKSELKIRFKNEQLNAEVPQFQLSRGAAKAVELLNEELYNRIYHQTELKEPLNKIILIYRIYIQLLANNTISSIQNDNEFWISFCKFLLENNNNQTGTFFINSIQNFDFSPENLYKVKRILGSKANEIKPTNYSKICGTTGLVIFLIKDALEYCGIIQNDKKNIPSILLKNLEYLETIENKVDKYIDMLKS